ncbi:hypothetical protein Tco_1281276 [Tanacetum coccineum]
MYSTALPPKPRKMSGRLRKKRIKFVGEGGSSTRVSKVVEQTPKPKGVVGRPRNKQSMDDLEDVDVVQRGPLRDKGASGSRGGAKGSRGRRGAAGSKGGASGSRGGASVSRRVEGRSRGGSSMSGGASRSTGRGSGRSGGANGSRGRGASRSRGKGAGGSKRKPVSNAGTQKRQGKKKVGTSRFSKWFGLQDEPEQT